LIEKYKNFYLSFLLLPVCFISYANPPIMAALSLTFLLKRKYKEFVIFSIPCLIYITTYFGFHFFSDGVERRIDKNLSIIYFIKNFFLQTLSLVDSFIGPSFFLKIFYSYKEISIFYLIFIIVIIISIYKIPFKKEAVLAIVGAALGGSLTTIIATKVTSFGVSKIPYVGSVVSLITQPAISYATTYAIGLLFIKHFENNGNLLNFDLESTKAVFDREFEKAKAVYNQQLKNAKSIYSTQIAKAKRIFSKKISADPAESSAATV
jgi:hypothetical protein